MGCPLSAEAETRAAIHALEGESGILRWALLLSRHAEKIGGVLLGLTAYIGRSTKAYGPAAQVG